MCSGVVLFWLLVSLPLVRLSSMAFCQYMAFCPWPSVIYIRVGCLAVPQACQAVCMSVHLKPDELIKVNMQTAVCHEGVDRLQDGVMITTLWLAYQKHRQASSCLARDEARQGIAADD